MTYNVFGALVGR